MRKINKILITGSHGFIGSNLKDALKEKYGDQLAIYEFNSKSPINLLDEYAKDCDFVFFLSAVHRPQETSEFSKVNFELFDYLLNLLEKYDNKCPVLYTSSSQAGNGTEYGNSKINAETRLFSHAEKSSSRGILYRLTNTFGRWGRPNGHSVVATFCHNIWREIPITVNNPEHIMNFYYVEDVINSFIQRLEENPPFADDEIRYLDSNLTYSVTLGRLAELLYYFKSCVDNDKAPKLNGEFEEKLYNTYLSYKN